jgi:DUF1680 family protein
MTKETESHAEKQLDKFIERRMKKQKDNEKPICQYCKNQINAFKDSNHIIGCNLEAIAGILRWRGYEEEADKLENII